MADCCQSSLPSLSWNHAQHLTNRFGKFAVKACGARMWQNSLFTLNVNDETTVYTAATVLSWPCLMFQSRDLSTCMFYFCLLILRCILFRFHFSKHLENNPCLHPVAQRRASGEAKPSASKSKNGTSSETKLHMSSSHTYGDVAHTREWQNSNQQWAYHMRTYPTKPFYKVAIVCQMIAYRHKL